MPMASLHFVLDLDLADDKYLLQQLVAAHAAEANLRGLGYTQTDYVQESQGRGLIQNLAYDGHPIAGPVRNEDLFHHLVRSPAFYKFPCGANESLVHCHQVQC